MYFILLQIYIIPFFSNIMFINNQLTSFLKLTTGSHELIRADSSTALASVVGRIVGCQVFMYAERGMMRIKSTVTMSSALITLILLGRPIGK